MPIGAFRPFYRIWLRPGLFKGTPKGPMGLFLFEECLSKAFGRSELERCFGVTKSTVVPDAAYRVSAGKRWLDHGLVHRGHIAS